jgi:hypothetical protein
MKLTLAGIDILIGAGVGRSEAEDALLQALGASGVDVLLETENERLIALQPDDILVRALRLDDGGAYEIHLSIDAHRPIDFLPILRALQARLRVDLAVPDEESPLPQDILVFRTDGRIEKSRLDD